jgi:hypothetical protein
MSALLAGAAVGAVWDSALHLFYFYLLLTISYL